MRPHGWALPFKMENTVFSLIGNADTSLIISSIITIMPIALATMIEHIGDVCAISSTVERNYLADPGLHRTLLGDGLATSIAALFGAPANTTYGENTGVLALSRVYDPRVIRIAAGLAVLLSFCPKFAALISAMPVATMGGVSMVLYGMISAVGVRNVVENKRGLYQQPQRHHRGPDNGTRHRNHLQRGGRRQDRQRKPLRPCRSRHSGHTA